MNQTTRQRIVGTLVLVLMAVILLPAILDGEGSYQQDLERRIPVAPPTPDIPSISARRPVVTADTDAIRVDDAATRLVQPVPTPVPLAETAPEVDPTDESDVAESAEPEAALTVPAVPTAPRLDSSGLPEAWSVQLGAFSNQDNVQALVQRLMEAGHPAYTRLISSAQGPLTGVYVGPKVDRATAVELQAELADTFALSGRVVRYQIEEQ